VSLSDLDPLLSAPKRLRLLAILRGSAWAEFGFLHESLDIAKADMSKQMSALVDAGYATSKRVGGRRGGTTWFKITADGRKVYDNHVQALRSLTDEVPVSTASPSDEPA